jgi:predicted XRE-type DNA-binding protein
MSHNPFLDLGFSREEAVTLQIRSQLAVTLEQYIERKGWSQSQAAQTLKIPQPTVSKIINGNTDKLSVEFLIKLMVRAGLPIEIHSGRIRQRTRRAPRATATP